jgi:DNA-binding LytR/AlgR family response regulator
MKGFLSQPYPVNESLAHKLRATFLPAFFVFGFLFAFRPFGLHRFPNELLALITAGYGLVTLLVVAFHVFIIMPLFKGLFDETRWTVLREILNILWIIFWIGCGNALYSLSIFEDEFSFSYIFSFQAFTVMVAILPVTLNVLIMQLLLTRKNLKMAQELTEHMHHKRRLDALPGQLITICSENKKEDLTLPAADLLFIRSADNYIEVHYLDHETPKMKLIRSTLKNAREDLRHFTAFYRCHRAWIVNLDRVESVTGNSQGYRLLLNGTDTIIPVSRNLNEELNNRLAK